MRLDNVVRIKCEVKRCVNFQSADASVEVDVHLDEGETPGQAISRFMPQLFRRVDQVAHDRLDVILGVLPESAVAVRRDAPTEDSVVAEKVIALTAPLSAPRPAGLVIEEYCGCGEAVGSPYCECKKDNSRAAGTPTPHPDKDNLPFMRWVNGKLVVVDEQAVAA